jgi:hypothetical protein
VGPGSTGICPSQDYKSCGAGPVNLDLSSFPKGLYYLSITAEQNKLTKKLILE